MTILFFVRFYSPHVGGVEKHLSEVIQRLLPHHNIIVVTEQHDSTLETHEFDEGVEIFRIPIAGNERNKKWHIWAWFARHLQLFMRADVIHIHDVFFWALPFRFLFFWKKMYVTFHGYEAPNEPTRKAIFWHQFAAFLTDGNICVGDFHRRWYGISPTFVTYGSCDTPVLGTPHQKSAHRFIFVGRLAEDTNIMTYLKALLIIHHKHEAYHADVYGDGPLRAACELFVRQNQLEVTFHGMVPNAQHNVVDADVVFGSQYLAILSALAYGVRVIAVAQRQIKEQYLSMTPFHDWIQVAHTSEEVAEMIQHPLSVDALKQAQVWAQQQTWQKLTEQYRELWKE